MTGKKVKPTGNSIVRAVKASGQSCNMLSIYDMNLVPKCPIYLPNTDRVLRTVLVEEQ